MNKGSRLVELLEWFRTWSRRRKNVPARRNIPLCVEELETRMAPAIDAFGPRGIDAQGIFFLGGLLDGSQIPIGQIELGRPGKAGTGANDDPNVHHPDVTPTKVFRLDGNPTANGGTNGDEIRRDGDHATKVAGVMIGTGANRDDEGVAMGAELYASATATPVATDAVMAHNILISLQKVLRPGAPGVNVQTQAVNVSFRVRDPEIDGNKPVNLGFDWMAGTTQLPGPAGYKSLLVMGSGNDNAASNLLASAYNGLVVASTSQNAGVFDKVDRDNSLFQIASNDRFFINLVAPGVRVRVPTLGDERYGLASGSSIAAPQVTAAAAMLDQYAQYMIGNANDGEHWNADSLQPMVMKAVLMNSADKVAGRLGMKKTILRDGNENWDIPRQPTSPVQQSKT